MKLLASFAVLYWAAVALAVKEYLFKNCDNSGFCHRNKHWARQVAAASRFDSPYKVDPESVAVRPGAVAGTIVKSVQNVKVSLPFELSFGDSSFRFTVDEERAQDPASRFVNKRRFNEAANWSFGQANWPLGSSEAKIDSSKNSVSATFGQYRLELQYDPVRIDVYDGQSAVLAINSDNFFNLEHARPKNANSLHISDLESDFDSFSDGFADSKADTLPVGPESVAVDVTFFGFSNVYGIPEHANTLNLQDTSDSKLYRLFNVDIFEYETHSNMPMYGSIPLMVASKPGASVGVFWNNAADTFVDIRKTDDVRAHWMSEAGIIDVTVILGDTPASINRRYGQLTGYSTLPQLFSLGYHQCRWNYNDEKDVLMVSAKMDEAQIPMDTIWLDIEYAESKKYFTWSKDNFPDPARLLSRLDDVSRNLVIIIDPHLKVGYHISDAVEQQSIGINNAQNETYHGHCWPGESVWIDSFNPTAQSFWDDQFRYGDDNEFMGKLKTNMHLWNDMSENSVFNGPETSSPKDSLHYGGWEERSVHNLNGLAFHELTYNSLTKRLSSTDRQRPFILTRSYYAGSQRTAAMWTGDNMSKWEYLQISIPMVLTQGVVGMPFAGADVGGFFGDPDKDLLARWYQAGIWYPFFRAHAHIDSRRREPYLIPEPYQGYIRVAIKLRYSLLPELYTAFYESSISGLPIVRPLFYENPESLDNYNVEDQFFLGGIMVKPVTEQNARQVSVVFPDDEIYYDFTNGKISDRTFQETKIARSVDLNDIPMYIKGGNVVFRKERYRRSTKLMKNDPYTLTVALSKKSQAQGTLYIDDYESFGYQEGQSLLVKVEASASEIKAQVTSSAKQTQFISSIVNKIERVTILQASDVSSVTVNQGGQQWVAETEQQGANLVIKNPKIEINTDWTIELKYENVHDEL